MKFKANPRTLIIGGLVLASAVILVRLTFFPTKRIPQDFSEARIKGAAIAKHIVDLSNTNISGLEEIAKYDKNGDVAQALILISQQLLKNRANQEEAVRLAGQLEKMALSLSSVKPAKAQRLATAAVTAEVALVSRLVNYNDYLKQLFEILRSKFDGSVSYSNGRVEELIKKINEEMEVINDLDRRFNEALWELDNLDL